VSPVVAAAGDQPRSRCRGRFPGSRARRRGICCPRCAMARSGRPRGSPGPQRGSRMRAAEASAAARWPRARLSSSGIVSA